MKIIELSQTGQYDDFAKALWECLLLPTEISQELKARLQEIKKGENLESKLKEIIKNSIGKDIWTYNRQSKSENSKKTNPSEENPPKSSNPTFGWLAFWNAPWFLKMIGKSPDTPKGEAGDEVKKVEQGKELKKFGKDKK